jgi:hypothetical protein
MAKATLLDYGATASGSAIYVPAGTQCLAFLCHYYGSEDDLDYLRIDGENATLLDHDSSYNGTGTTRVACQNAIFVGPEVSQNVTLTFSPTGYSVVWFAITGIDPRDPISQEDTNTMATTERYNTNAVTVAGEPVFSLVIARNYFNGELIEDITTDTHTNLSYDCLYANMPADGDFRTGSYKSGSGISSNCMVNAISFNLPPAIRRAGIILD